MSEDQEEGAKETDFSVGLLPRGRNPEYRRKMERFLEKMKQRREES